METADAAVSLACGLLICVATFCIAYAVLKVWPRNHYPRVFSVLAAVATVASLYLLYLPGTGFALVVLLAVMFFSVFAVEEVVEWLKGPAPQKANPSSKSSAVASSPSLVLPLSLGAVCGIAVSLLAVSIFLVPPTYLQRWVFHPDPLGDRIERALNAVEQHPVTEAPKAELADASEQLTGTVSASSKAREEPGATATTSSAIRGLKIKARNSSRQADGTIYIGVEAPSTTVGYVWCKMNASSDKVSTTNMKLMRLGEALAIQSSRGKFRIVLTALDNETCTFDLVKD